jgi:hypothetical protein
MFELIDNTFVLFWSVFQQTVDILMGSSCATGLTYSLYSYEADLIQTYLQKKRKQANKILKFHVPL